jgi:O-antigen ligase
MSKILDKTIAVGLLVLVAFTALAFGTVEPWTIALFELGATLLLLLWMVKAVVDRGLAVNVPAAAIPLMIFVALALAECVSYTAADGRRVSLSRDVDATRSTALMLIFLLVSFIIAANFFTSRERLGTLIRFLIIYGVALALFGLIQYFTWEGRVYGFRVSKSNVVFGPFINRNHFAGYMEMLIPVPISLIMARVVHKQTWMFYGFAASVMGLALVMSGSRGGMISLTAGLIFIAVASSQLRRNIERRRFEQGSTALVLKRIGAIAAIGAAIFIGVVWIGAEEIVRRAGETIDQMKGANQQQIYVSRQWIWKGTWNMVRANPLLGVGIGAYETVYPAYAGGDDPYFRVDFAHNDYLQVLADAGVVGGMLALWFIFLVARAVWRGIKASDPWMAAMALASGAGIFSILVHSLFDFNLQIPSNSLLFLLLSALASYAGASADPRAGEDALKRAARSGIGDSATGV